MDPALGVPLPEKSYGNNCDLTWPNIKDQVLDIFVIGHTLGWVCKYIIFRDTWLAWTMSIMFEIMEYSLQHQLPNFEECWWDHWILDVLVCNWLGIWIGQTICHYLEMKVRIRVVLCFHSQA
jgi:phosphatidylserine synthase 2